MHIAQSPEKAMDGTEVQPFPAHFFFQFFCCFFPANFFSSVHFFQVRAELRGCTYLEDSSVTIRGVKIYGEQSLYCDCVPQMLYNSKFWMLFQCYSGFFKREGITKFIDFPIFLTLQQCVTVPKMLDDTDTDTFFRYQIFLIPIPVLFSVPNFSDTGSETFFRYQI